MMRSLTGAVGAGLIVVVSAVACRDSTAIESADVPASMTATSARTQTAIVMRAVAVNPTVRVVDQRGRPIGGVSVLFTATGGTASRTLTSTDGIASQSWQLGPRAGTQTVVVTVPQSTLPAVTFTATALADTAAALSATSAQLQAALALSPVPLPPTVVVVDAFGNGKAGAQVTFEVTGGEGNVTPATVITDESGRGVAQRWMLGRGLGENTLIARSPGFAPVTFIARVNTQFSASTVATGERHSCAIALTGETYCWGGNNAAQINGSAYSSFVVPTRIATPHKFISLATASLHTCAVSDEVPARTYCWGGFPYGPVPAGGAPVEAPIPDGATFVTAGGSHDCALTPLREAYCWGAGVWGQLGDGATDTRELPLRVATDARFVSLAAGAQHSCGLTATGDLYCWGLDDHGQLGFVSGANCFIYDYLEPDTPVQCALVPRRVPSVPAFVAIAAGFGTCALTAQGEVYCAGYGSTAMATVSRGIRFASLAPDGNCGLTAEGAAYCWAATVATGVSTLSNALMAVGNGIAFRAITSSLGHQCGILAKDDTVLCWGANDVGQLGNGTTAPGIVPLPVTGPDSPK
jgi:hypothetical protein